MHEEFDGQWPVDYEDEDETPIAAIAPPARVGVGVHDLSLRDYLADPCAQPSLRSSDINTLLRHGPSKMRALHPRLTEDPNFAMRKATRRMDLGTVIHELVLGKGSGFCVIDPADFKTKKGEPSKSKNTEGYRAAAADAQARGLVILDPAANTAAQRIAEKVARHLEAEFGTWPVVDTTERTLVWTEIVGGQTVYCRTRPDIFALEFVDHSGGNLCVDLKSCSTGLSDDDLQRTMSDHDGAMFVQAAWQRRGVVALHPELDGRLDSLTHIFVETEPPYDVRPIDASAIMLEHARRRCLRAVEIFAECTATGEFPHFSRGLISGAPWLDTKWTAQGEADATT